MRLARLEVLPTLDKQDFSCPFVYCSQVGIWESIHRSLKMSDVQRISIKLLRNIARSTHGAPQLMVQILEQSAKRFGERKARGIGVGTEQIVTSHTRGSYYSIGLDQI